MSVHEQYYLTCNGCGGIASDKDRPLFGETMSEVRGLAEDELGWESNDSKKKEEDALDYCQTCIKNKLNKY